MGRDLGHRVLGVEQVLPIGVDRVRARQIGREPDDGHVRRPGVSRFGGGRLGRCFETCQIVERPFTDLAVQRVDIGLGIPDLGDLPDHVHAFLAAAGFLDVQKLIALPFGRLRCDAQATEREAFKLFAHLLGAGAIRLERAAPGGEFGGKGRHGRAGGMARAGFQRDGFFALQKHVLEILHDAAARDAFFGEEIGGAHEHAGLDAAFGKRCGEGRDHGGRPRVMDAAGKEDADVVALPFGYFGQKRAHHVVPQNEARGRAHVTAAFTALENEPLRALFKEHRQKLRRGHMEVGRNAIGLERNGLIGTPPRDERKAGPVFQRDRDLILDQLAGRKAQKTHAPGLALEPLCRLFQQRVGLRGPHQRQRHHRQRAAVAHRLREGRGVGHARHRPLHDGPAGAMRLGHALPFAQGRVFHRAGDRLFGRAIKGSQKPPEALVFGGQCRREGRSLAHRCQVARAHVPAKGGPRDGGLFAGVVFLRKRGAEFRGSLETGLFDASPVNAAGAFDQRRLAAGHPGQNRGNTVGECRFPQAQKLVVQHDAHGAARPHGARGIKAHTAPHVDITRTAGERLLEKDKGRGLAHPTPGLVALDDQPFGRQRPGEPVVPANGLGHDRDAHGPDRLDHVGRGQTDLGGQHDQPQPARAIAPGQRGGCLGIGHRNAKARCRLCGQRLEPGVKDIVPKRQFGIQDPDIARAARSHRKARITGACRGHHQKSERVAHDALSACRRRGPVRAGLVRPGVRITAAESLFHIQFSQPFPDLLDPLFEELAGRGRIVGVWPKGHLAVTAAQAPLLQPFAQTAAGLTGPAAQTATKAAPETTPGAAALAQTRPQAAAAAGTRTLTKARPQATALPKPGSIALTLLTQTGAKTAAQTTTETTPGTTALAEARPQAATAQTTATKATALTARPGAAARTAALTLRRPQPLERAHVLVVVVGHDITPLKSRIQARSFGHISGAVLVGPSIAHPVRSGVPSCAGAALRQKAPETLFHASPARGRNSRPRQRPRRDRPSP